MFATLPIARVFARLVAVSSRTAGDIKISIRPNGNMSDAMIKRSDAPWIIGLEPRFWDYRLACSNRASGAKDGDLVGDDCPRFVALVHDR